MFKLHKYDQVGSECAVASSASIAHFYNKEIDYSFARKIAKKINKRVSKEGLFSNEIVLLLNYLGFQKVILVTADVDIFDLSWHSLSQKRIKEVMEKIGNKRGKGIKKDLYLYAKTLFNGNYKNKIILDYDWHKHIKKSIDKKLPLLASINTTVLFKYPKYKKNKEDPIHGESEEHLVVICGYDSKGSFIMDSHKRGKCRQIKYIDEGIYHIKWHSLITALGLGDLYIPERYKSELVRYN